MLKYLVPLATISVAVFLARKAIQMSEAASNLTAAMDRLTQEVTETRGDLQSAVTYIQGVPQMVRDAVAAAVANSNGNADVLAAQLNTFADELDASQGAVQDAINANASGGSDTVAGGQSPDDIRAAGGDTSSASVGTGDPAEYEAGSDESNDGDTDALENEDDGASAEAENEDDDFA